ncbi:hypothetical protein G5I_02908 [Acromyrmex echinatior]|uniref:Uncharacterized protein n=1 Tax=Acromyrmex echinatior TaxID=103372 RepID=F4WBJ5_ACREC|nr:hypothetical protein G5I_02908 [Acromyrmex echinatior]
MLHVFLGAPQLWSIQDTRKGFSRYKLHITLGSPPRVLGAPREMTAFGEATGERRRALRAGRSSEESSGPCRSVIGYNRYQKIIIIVKELFNSTLRVESR